MDINGCFIHLSCQMISDIKKSRIYFEIIYSLKFVFYIYVEKVIKNCKLLELFLNRHKRLKKTRDNLNIKMKLYNN